MSTRPYSNRWMGISESSTHKDSRSSRIQGHTYWIYQDNGSRYDSVRRDVPFQRGRTPWTYGADVREPLTYESKDIYKNADKLKEKKRNDYEHGCGHDPDNVEKGQLFTNGRSPIKSHGRPLEGDTARRHPLPLEENLSRQPTGMQPVGPSLSGWNEHFRPGAIPDDAYYNQPTVEVINDNFQVYNMSDLFESPPTSPCNDFVVLFCYPESSTIVRSAADTSGSSTNRNTSTSPQPDGLFKATEFNGRGYISSGSRVETKEGQLHRRKKTLFEPGKRRSRYYEFYKFEKVGEDWTLADRILMKAPQHELEKKVAKTRIKGKVALLDKMKAMTPLRRDQVLRLLDEKSDAENDRDAEWNPVLIHETKWRGKSVLAMDVIVAKSFKADGPTLKPKEGPFLGEKSDLRDPIRSKAKAINANKYSIRDDQKVSDDQGRPPYTQHPSPYRNVDSTIDSDDHQHYTQRYAKRLSPESAVIQGLDKDIDESCAPETGASVGKLRSEAKLDVLGKHHDPGNHEIHALKKLKIADTESPLITFVAPAATAGTSPQPTLQIRPGVERSCPIRERLTITDTDCNNILAEATEISNRLSRYFAYYCPISGCIYSASPDLCDLDSRNARTIHERATHKIYVLDGLPETALQAHILEEHTFLVRESRIGQIFDLSTYKHTPVVAEERRFTVASETIPDACGWLMRTRIAGQPWSDWKGIDYDTVAASGFVPWECRTRLQESQSSPSTIWTNAAKDGIHGPSLESEYAVDELAGKTGVGLERPNELLFNGAADEKRHVIDYLEALPMEDGLDAGKRRHPYNKAMVQTRADDLLRTPTRPNSSGVCHGACPGADGSVQSINDERGFSQRETTSDDDIGSDFSITMRKKRSVIESIMNEFHTLFFGKPSCNIHCRGEGSGSTSSSDGTKLSSCFDQMSQSRSSTSTGKKRAQGNEAFSDDDGDSTQKRHKKSATPSGTTARVRLLACPFNKHNPKVYSPCNDSHDYAHKFRSCGGPGWKTVARLKEHLYRVHPTPIQCARCWLTMKTEKELETHVRDQETCVVQPQLVQWVPRDRVKTLKDRKKGPSNQSEEERWKYVYGLLFPEDLSLPSPYYDDSEQGPQDEGSQSPSTRNFAAFERYSQENLPRRIRDSLEAMLHERVLPIEESLKRALPEIMRACQAQIFRDWERLNSCDFQGSAQDTLVDDVEARREPGRRHRREVSLSGDDSLSNFYVEPAHDSSGYIFNSPLWLNNNGEGSSQAIADSGYNTQSGVSNYLHLEAVSTPTPMPASGNVISSVSQDHLEDLGIEDLNPPIDFNWDDYISEHRNSSVE